MERRDILQGYWFRHACKEFDPKRKVSEEDFNCILESARLSPSSFGFEPWHFLVVKSEALRAELQPLCWGGARQIPSCSHLVLTLAKKGYFMHWGSPYVKYMEKEVHHLPPNALQFYAEHVRHFQEHDFELLESDRALTDWATHQTYIPLANMMMTAAYLGIDSCPMEGFCKREMNEFLAGKKLMDPGKYTLAHAVAFGYRIREPHERTRQTLAEIVTVI